eukprot:COSAG02_NODE_5425_length_4343_cov_2.410697_5_plen_222_part_00
MQPMNIIACLNAMPATELYWASAIWHCGLWCRSHPTEVHNENSTLSERSSAVSQVAQHTLPIFEALVRVVVRTDDVEPISIGSWGRDVQHVATNDVEPPTHRQGLLGNVVLFGPRDNLGVQVYAASVAVWCRFHPGQRDQHCAAVVRSIPPARRERRPSAHNKFRGQRTGAAEILAEALRCSPRVQVLVRLDVEVNVVLRPRLQCGLIRGVDIKLLCPGQR